MIHLFFGLKPKNVILEMGLSENSVPLNPMVLLIIIPIFNGYFIGNIPNIFRQTHIFIMFNGKIHYKWPFSIANYVKLPEGMMDVTIVNGGDEPFYVPAFSMFLRSHHGFVPRRPWTTFRWRCNPPKRPPAEVSCPALRCLCGEAWRQDSYGPFMKNLIFKVSIWDNQ